MNFGTIKKFITDRSALVAEAIGVGILIIVIVIMGVILQGVSDSQAPTAAQLAANDENFTTVSYNLSNQGLVGFSTFATFFSLIVLVVVGAYLIRLLGFFGNAGNGGL